MSPPVSSKSQAPAGHPVADTVNGSPQLPQVMVELELELDDVELELELDEKRHGTLSEICEPRNTGTITSELAVAAV